MRSFTVKLRFSESLDFTIIFAHYKNCHTRPQGLDAPTSCPSLCVGYLKTKKAGMNANLDHSKNARQFSGINTLQTHTQGTNTSHAVELPVAQLDLDVLQSDRQLTPIVATNALIQSTTRLPFVQGQLAQILKVITGASLQETDFYATNMSNTQVLEVMQCVARSRSFYNTRKYQQQIDNSCCHFRRQTRSPQVFQLQALEFWELGKFTIQHIMEGNLTETLIDTVSELVLALRQAERTNLAIIGLFLGSTPIYLIEIITL
ncbi:MAG: hypothetical protein EZS28_033810 [Streblomastix strix]|uniref:Uncharacterized protein n=1 Tax=Streblomastix strix TaxID=222440 RepID=A0A5J4ULS0_9EUKA|nr:MAG: hypothetical protein EZS28_033810 [Streblomastix strix]